MKRVNIKTGEKYNKKTRFSDIPEPYIVVADTSEVKTGFDLYRSIMMHKKGYWLDFAQYHIFRNELIKNQPVTEQLQLYLVGVEYSTRKQIINILSDLKYNPFQDEIPFDKLPQNLQSFFSKRKEIIKNTYKILKENLIIEKNILLLPTTQDLSRIEIEILFKLGVDLIIIKQEKKCSILYRQQIRYFYEIKGKTIKLDNIHNILKEFNSSWNYLKEKEEIVCLNNNDTLEDIILTIKTNIF